MPTIDGRNLRRRLEAEVRELGGTIRPALYEASPGTSRAEVRLPSSAPPFVLCGLLAASDVGSGSVVVNRNGRTYCDGTAVPARAVIAAATGNAAPYRGERDWVRPILLEGGDTFALEGLAVRVLLGGFHVEERHVADELRRRGEFWAAALAVPASSGVSYPVFRFARSAQAAHLLGPSDAYATFADSIELEIAGVKITPVPLRSVALGGTSTTDPTSWLDIPVAAGDVMQAVVANSGAGFVVTLLGAAVYE